MSRVRVIAPGRAGAAVTSITAAARAARNGSEASPASPAIRITSHSGQGPHQRGAPTQASASTPNSTALTTSLLTITARRPTRSAKVDSH